MVFAVLVEHHCHNNVSKFHVDGRNSQKQDEQNVCTPAILVFKHYCKFIELYHDHNNHTSLDEKINTFSKRMKKFILIK